MVTFVCSYCDATLKKKQLENHTYGSCRPSSFICIDCHTTFNGNDYKTHTKCLTEFEKHWGEYAKPKKVTQNSNSHKV
jgi:cell growth-regulating nucleolar protein